MTADELNNQISLKIEKSCPLSAPSLGNAIISLNELFKDCCAFYGADTVLELKSVEKGSDILNFLISFSKGSLSFVKELNDGVNSAFTLIKSLKAIGKKSVDDIKNDELLTKNALKSIEDIVNLCDEKTTISIENKGVVNNYISINNSSKQDYLNGINEVRKIKDLDNKKEVKLVYEKMNISFYQTTNTQRKDIKFRAYCFELSQKAISTIIDDNNMKDEILANPYEYNFICDLEVYKDKDGKITLFRAFNFLDKIKIEKD